MNQNDKKHQGWGLSLWVGSGTISRMINRFFLKFLCLSLMIVTTVLPVVAHADDAGQVRTLLRLVEGQSWSAAQRIAASGSSNVKLVYEWLSLGREDASQDFGRYVEFLNKHGNFPGTRRIRANAERVMPTTLPAGRVVAFYQGSEPVTARGMIAYVRALEEIGDENVAMLVNNWFKEASLSSDEQTQIYTAFKSLLLMPTLRHRLDHMMLEGNITSAQGLARLMAGGYPDLILARMALNGRARDIEYKLQRVPVALRYDPGLVVDRLKYRRRQTDDSAGMIELFNSLPEGFRPYDSRAFWNEQQALIYRLMEEKNYQMAYRVAARDLHDDRFAQGQSAWLAGHLALVYLKQPGRAFRHFEGLYKIAISPLTRARAAYWAGEASVALGYPDVARAWYRTASAYRGNFYGQLAAVRIPAAQRPYRQGPPIANEEDRKVFDQSELPRFARLMRRAGDTRRAQMFVNRLAEEYETRPGLMRLTVDLALELKLTSLAVKISRLAATEGIDFADHVYPTLSGVGTGGVETALVYAVIRQESGFDEDAVSDAGARGLMQLMPSTARDVARAEKQKHQHDWLTTRPEHNVRLGSAYLRQLIDRYDSYALAAAAYNAGPGRVNQWLQEYGDPRQGEIGLVDWIERIPFYETRNYVQRILEGTAVYRQKLKISSRAPLDPLHLGQALRIQ